MKPILIKTVFFLITNIFYIQQELDYYKGQHRAAMNQLEVSTQDSAALRTKYGEVMTENQRLEQDNQNLRRQQEVMISDNGNSDSLFLLGRRNERDDCETLRKRYEDLLASHSQAITKLERAQDEINSLNKQCEELSQERNTIV